MAPRQFTICYQTHSAGSQLEVRKGSPDGPVVCSATLPDNGWKWKEIILPVQDGSMDKETLYLVATKAPLAVKYFRFNE